MPKYIFNKETLKYEEISQSKRFRLTKGIVLFVSSLVMAFFWTWIYTSVLGFSLPKTAMLEKTNAKLTSSVEILDRQLEKDGEYLASMQLRDNDIYRSVFGMGEIPSEVRNAGFGGVNRYSYLEQADRTGLLKKTQMKLDILTKKAAVQGASFDEVESVAQKAGDMAACIPSVPPIVPDKTRYRLSSSFGYRSDPFSGRSKRHTGVDFATGIGNDVFSTADGVVETVKKEYFGYGNYVIINHGFGYKTRYAHLSEISVTEGMTVRRGEKIALSGNSGRSSGPHLHYEVIYRDNYVNPAKYMDLDMTVDEYTLLVDKVSAQAEDDNRG